MGDYSKRIYGSLLSNQDSMESKCFFSCGSTGFPSESFLRPNFITTKQAAGGKAPRNGDGDCKGILPPKCLKKWRFVFFQARLLWRHMVAWPLMSCFPQVFCFARKLLRCRVKLYMEKTNKLRRLPWALWPVTSNHQQSTGKDVGSFGSHLLLF